MKILLVGSTSFYGKIEEIKKELIKRNFEVEMPNCYDDPVTNEDNKKMTDEEYNEFFKRMYYESRDKISKIDAILVLNYDKTKDGKLYKNYVGASTFLEMYEAFMQNKKIYMLNGYPDNILYDEIKGFNPVIIDNDINKI